MCHGDYGGLLSQVLLCSRRNIVVEEAGLQLSLSGGGLVDDKGLGCMQN